MIEYFVEFLRQLPTAGVLVFVCFLTFLENVFPPSPSDMVLVFCGTLIGFSGIDFVPMVIAATTGSLLGFASMYAVGVRFGDSIKHSNSRFLPREAIERAEVWFYDYGYWLIVVNRFLSGTRAVISLFAGMSKLPFTPTIVLSALSAAVWNAVLLGAGAMLGKNWASIEGYLSLYGQFAVGAVVVVAIVLIARFWWRARSVPKPETMNQPAPIEEQNPRSSITLPLSLPAQKSDAVLDAAPEAPAETHDRSSS